MTDLSPREIDALERVVAKPVLAPFFLRKLKGLKWFDALEARGFFDPKHHLGRHETADGYFAVPSWPVLDYLEKTGPELLDPRNRSYSARYIRIIRSVTSDAITRGISNFRTWWQFSKLLCWVNEDELTIEDIGLISYWLKDPVDRGLAASELGLGLLPHLLGRAAEHSRKLALELLRALTEVTPPAAGGEQGRAESARLPLDKHHASEVFGAHGRSIGERLRQDGVAVLDGRLREALGYSRRSNTSAIWRPAIEDHEQNLSRDEAEHILIEAYRDALLGYVDRSASGAADLITRLLADSESIFRRLAIYAVSQYPLHLQSLVSRILVAEFFRAEYRHEVFTLLDKAFVDLRDDQKHEVLRHIDQACGSGSASHAAASYEALCWLSAVRGKGYEPADAEYARHASIAGAEPEHPEFSSYIAVGWISERAEYTARELLDLGLSDLLQLLSSYEPKSGWNEPTRRGLANELEAAVLANPEHFRGQLLRFSNLHFDYVTSILDAFRRLWDERSYDCWPELLSFCDSILSRDGFWDPIEASDAAPMTANREWAVASIADLMKSGTASDEKAFDPDLMDRAENILDTILRRQRSERFKDARHALTTAINSPRGKSVEALILYALRLCRLADGQTGSHRGVWAERLGHRFEQEIRLVEAGACEFAALFGAYILNLLYIDRAWSLGNLHRVFDKSDRLRWACAIGGYTYVSRIDGDVYSFLRDGRHLLAALDSDEIGDRGKGRIVENIAVAYLHDRETLGDTTGALSALLERGRHHEIHHLVWFIWAGRESASPQMLNAKLLPLWGAIDRMMDAENAEHRRVLSSLCMWASFVSDGSEPSASLLLRAAPYANEHHGAFELVSELRRIVSASPSFVADVYEQMLTRFAPFYPQADIETTLEAFYNAGPVVRQKANRIVDKFIENGIEFPALVRERHRTG